MSRRASQVAVTDVIRTFAADIAGDGLEFLNNAAEKVHLAFTRLPVNDETKASEAAIRWRRPATQIINDGYVYKGKSCTDEVVVFLAVCRSRGFKTRFVKLRSNKSVHSVAEVELSDGWYIVDVSSGSSARRGEYKAGEESGDFLLWKKGRDAWDLGLTSVASKMDGRTIT